MANPKSPKTMSSRLLTMKFMQRAAAASVSSTPTTQSPSTPTPSQLQQQPYDTLNASTPSPKRQKTSSHSASAPSTPARSNADLEAISAAIRAEEEKRAAAIARQAAEAGEEEWVIEYPPGTFPEPPSQTVMDGGAAYGFGDGGDEEVMGGRLSFGGFKRKGGKGVATAPSSSHNANGDGDVDGDGEGDDEDEENDDDRSGSGSDDGEDDEDDDLDALLKAARQKSDKKRAEKRWNSQNGKKRKSGDGAVDLSRLTSISGGIDKGEQQRQHKRHQNQRGGSGGGRKGRR
ncbi:hypothetical protein GX51_00460 [Blastomyces parvus]|uniref:Uncharacterized protein n=1 Tax=Blastomyces parvus TaxID=2060905 RepID=A0A2B7XKU0_9EURO|nr:hypothetical protein GX51_00460 [Blastomyces parvus]